MKELLFLFLNLSSCSFPLVNKFREISTMYTLLLSSGHSWHSIWYVMPHLRQSPPSPWPDLQGRHLASVHPAVAVGFDFCIWDFIDDPPVSTILKCTPASASLSTISLKAFANSPEGVGSTKIGAIWPPFVDQAFFLLFLSNLLSTLFQFFDL